MTKKDVMEVIGIFVTLGLLVLVGLIGGLYVSSRVVKRQQDKIDILNQTIGEYKINEEWFEDYVDVLEEIYEGKINESVLEERVKWLENKKSVLTFDMLDNYWLVEIVSREPFGDDGYYYQIKVVGTSDYGYQVSYELFSIGELALAIEFEDGQVVMIDFNN